MAADDDDGDMGNRVAAAPSESLVGATHPKLLVVGAINVDVTAHVRDPRHIRSLHAIELPQSVYYHWLLGANSLLRTVVRPYPTARSPYPYRYRSPPLPLRSPNPPPSASPVHAPVPHPDII